MAASLGITYLQVFVWVHGFMRHLPHAYTYSLLVISIGWLILYAERRALELRQTPLLHGGESFLGFAFIGLGLLMGFTQPTVRILCFVAAAWSGCIRRSRARTAALLDRTHIAQPRRGFHWITASISGGTFALPGNQPGGLLWAWEVGPARSANDKELSRACLGMQVAVLFVTAMVAPLAQWHFHSRPALTAGWLVLVAIFLAWRAFTDRKLHWLHATALFWLGSYPMRIVDMTA